MNTTDGSDIGALEAAFAPIAPVPPTVAYNPAAASTIVFPAAQRVLRSAVAVSSSGGVAPKSVSVANCFISAGFLITNAPITFNGTAGGELAVSFSFFHSRV